MEIASGTAVWRHAGLPVVPVRWGLVRDPHRRFDLQALLCTNLAEEPLRVIRRFVQPWQVEVTFREVRDHLGVLTAPIAASAVRRLPGRLLMAVVGAVVSLLALRSLLAVLRPGGGCPRTPGPCAPPTADGRRQS